MGMLSQLLADGGTEFMDGLKWLVVILVSIAGSLCIIYAIYIGYLFATATDDGKRRAAKDRLIKVISSGLIIFALAMCLTVIDVNFSKPVADGREETEEGDLLDGMTGASESFVYKDYIPSDWLQIYNDKTDSFKIEAKYLYQGETAINLSKFGGFTDFKISMTGLDSVFKNQYIQGNGKSCNITADGKTLTYYYQASGEYDDGKVDYYKLKSGENLLKDKYWKGEVFFEYDGEPKSAIAYFIIDDNQFKWGEVIDTVVVS